MDTALIRGLFSAKWLRTITLCLASVIAASCTPPTPPSDAYIGSLFLNHRPAFSQLHDMFSEDKIVGTLGCKDGSDDIDGSITISPERRAQYAKLLSEIGCGGSVRFRPGAAIEMNVTIWSVGMLWAGQDKGIVYRPVSSPWRIVDSTDGYHWTQEDHQAGAVELYRHIEGPWYVSYIAN